MDRGRNSKASDMRKNILLLVAACLLFASTGSRRANATTIDPMLWQQIASKADFIGVVECEVAGGVVAQYRVVESWKGAAQGKSLRIQVAKDYWGDEQFAMALCGERYLVAGYKAQPANMVSTTLSGGIPLWWRQLKPDLVTPLFQGRLRLPLDKANRLGRFGSKQADVPAFKTEIQNFLKKDSAEQERELLLALSKKYLFGRRSKQNEVNAETKQKVLTDLTAQTSHDDLCTALVALARKDMDYSSSVVRVLTKGREATLKFVAAIEDERPWSAKDHESILARLEWGLGKKPEYKTRPPVVPTENDLDQLRKWLNEGQSSTKFGQAFYVLSKHDPNTIVDYLMTWENTHRSWRDNDRGYFIGSSFAATCKANRKKSFNRLTNANSSSIRVAGAVYLCFEDENLGKRKLRGLTRLPGDPGAWAALALARRGEKKFLKRAIEAIRIAPVPHMDGYPHRNIQKRVIVLMSNIAHQNKLPAPKITWGYKPDFATSHRTLVSWLEKHFDEVKIASDPWGKELAQQKVD
jgi:hypothetical protein